MVVKTLIAVLQKADPDAVVIVCDREIQSVGSVADLAGDGKVKVQITGQPKVRGPREKKAAPKAA